MKTMLKLMGLMPYTFGFAGDDMTGGTSPDIDPAAEQAAPQTEDPAIDPSVTDTPPEPGKDSVTDDADDDVNKAWEEVYEKKGPENIVRENQSKAQTIKKLRAEMAAMTAALEQAKAGQPQTDPKVELPKQGAPEAKKDAQAPVQAPATADDKARRAQAMEYVRTNPRTSAAVKTLESIGIEGEGMQAIVDLIGTISAEIAGNYVGQSVHPIASRFYEQDFKDALTSVASDEKYKYPMSKIGKEVEDDIRKNYRPEHWKEREVIESVLGKAVLRHPELFSGPTKRIVDDTPPTATAASTGHSAELQSFAKQNGMDYATAEDREIVKAAYSAYRAAMKNKGEKA